MNATKLQVSGRSSVEVEKNINDSASRIQAGYQGYKTRKDYNTRKTFTKKGEPEKNTDEYEEMQNQQENEEMQTQRENEAAVKLQAGYRGYKVRKDYNNRRKGQSVEYDKEEKAATKIQAGYRGYKSRKAYKAQKDAKKVVDDIMSEENIEKYSQKDHDAATKIQAGYKGYQTRKHYASVKANKARDDNEREAAATRIQAGYKGYKTRKSLSQKSKEHSHTMDTNNDDLVDDKQGAAATKIQAGYRGYKTRKELKSQVIDGNKSIVRDSLDVAVHPKSSVSLGSSEFDTGSNKDNVTKLQVAFKAYKERRSYQITCLKANAAVKIQAAYKGYKIRLMKGLTSRKIEFEEFQKYKAALKIRSIFSGYLERKRAKQTKSLNVKSEHATKSTWIQNSGAEAPFIHTPQGPSHGTEKSYWEDSHIKLLSDEVRNEAATKVQSAFFSYYTRKKYYAWKERQAKKSQAAKKIQACFRGYVVRNKKTKSGNGKYEEEKFPSVKEPKSAVEIYGMERDQVESRVTNLERKLSKDLSDKDSCFTDNNSVSELPVYQREKSLGYETIVSVSGEIEKEGDSIKEIEDEAGELNAIEKHVNAIAALQSAVRAYKIRREFQELLSGGGELIDIAKVDRAVSALRKEFKYRSAKVRRLAVHQFETSIEPPWWEVEQSNAETLIPVPDDTEMRSPDGQPNSEVNIFVLDPTMTQEEGSVQSQSDSEVPAHLNVHEKKVSVIQAAYKGYVVRKQYSRDQTRYKYKNEEQTDVTVSNADAARKKHLIHTVDKTEAITVLQRAAKGYLQRKHVLKNEKSRSIIHAAYKGYVVRKRFSRDSKRFISQDTADFVSTQIINNDDKVSVHVRNEHIIVLQSAFKGYLCRKRVSVKMHTKPGTCIQSASKGFLYKKQLCKAKKHRKAEKKVQAAFKGYKTRKHSKSLFKREEMVKSETDHVQERSEHVEDIDNDDVIEKDSLSIIQATAKSHLKRKQMKLSANMDKQAAARTIQAACSGHIARKKVQAKQTASLLSPMEEPDESLIMTNATKLQAAFTGFQTRKVFKSLTKYVEDSETLDVSDHKLERMGSLSETDDFKLKHKSIIKIQTALQEHRQRNLTGVSVTVDGNYSRAVESRRFATSNKQHARSQSMPSKSVSTVSFAKVTDTKNTKKSPHTYKDNYKQSRPTTRDSRMTKVSKIENYIKLNIAASVIQASIRGYLKRKKLVKRKDNNPLKRKISTSTKSSQINMKQNGKVKARVNNATEKDAIRSQTASVKVEAERRKEIRTRVAAKDSIHAVKSKAEKLKAEKETIVKSEYATKVKGNASQTNTAGSQPSLNTSGASQTKKISEREAIVNINTSNTTDPDVSLNMSNTNIDVSNTSNDLSTSKSGRDFDKEYEVWKQERIEAAVLIQTGWRGYRARKDMFRQDQPVEFGVPSKMIVINIGRSKSEIEKSERRYNNASMIQMVYRTAKIRRKFKVKMAVKRYERNQAVTKLQAYYRSYATRKYTAERKCATQIQAAFKADLTRKRNIADKLAQKRNAASLIQATWLSLKTRQRNEAEKERRRIEAERNNASLSIQSAYRGYRERRDMMKKKIEQQKLAASQIQAALRGNIYRRIFQEKRVSATYIRASCKSYKIRLDLHNFKEHLKARKTAATEIVYAYKAHMKREEMRMYNERMGKENKAAVYIQCAVKGMIARRNERLRKELERRQNAAAVKIQSFYRGHLGRKMAGVMKNEKIRKELLHRKQCAAALKIQSVYRGHNGRKRARQERYKRELQRTSAEIIELLIERTISYLRQKSLAGIQLQWAVRGHLARVRNKYYKEKKRIEAIERKKMLDIAATMIQTAVRARRRRIQAKKAYKLREEHRAATKIQALYRGYSTRESIEREKTKLAKLSPLVISPDQDEILRNAQAIIAFHKNATLLQSAFKAYKMRAQVRERLIRKSFIVASSPRRGNSAKLLTHEDKAAVLIQKSFRGFSDRKMYGKMMRERKRKENKASDIIKASIDGYIVRRKQEVLRDKIDREGSAEVRHEKHCAANIIASAFRGYQKRKQKVALRVEM